MAAGFIIFLFVLKIFFNRFGHINLVQKIKEILIGVWHGLISVRSLKNKSLFSFIRIHVDDVPVEYLGRIFAIDATSKLGLADALTVLAMGSVGMILSPGGIGAYALLVMNTVALYNIPKNRMDWHSVGFSGLASFKFCSFWRNQFYIITPNKPSKNKNG
jgi:hypothetical protein